MTIYKDRHYANFTQISNAVIRSDLSDKALGALVRILSRPTNWEFNVQSFVRERQAAGETTTRTVLNELIKAGHIEEIKERDQKGRFKPTIYKIYETPKTKQENQPEEEKPPVKKDPEQASTVDVPRGENPRVDNDDAIPYYNKKRDTNTDLQRESEKTAHAETQAKQMFGKYKNVPLTPEEYNRLVELYSKDQTDKSLDGMSGYLASHNKPPYQNTYVRLDQWISQDIEKAKQTPVPYQSQSPKKQDDDFDVSMYDIFINDFDSMNNDIEQNYQLHEKMEREREEEFQKAKERENAMRDAHFAEMMAHMQKHYSEKEFSVPSHAL